jgi:P4 family phage/plasmid primase-like protien
MSDEMIQVLVNEAEEWSPDGQGDAHSAPRPLSHGSDVEIARCVSEDLQSRYGEIVFCEGHFWFYDASHWRAVAEEKLRRIVHRYDGEFVRKQVVKLSRNRIDSVIHEMGAMLAHPDFFNDAPPGINCASGFITFFAGTPYLVPHDPDHHCRHVLKGKWDGRLTGDDLALALLFSPLLGQLLRGVFLGDPDADQKVQVLQEIAGAAATGYGTQLRDPKAVILKGETAENGKSQILDLYRSLLPPEAVASIPAAKMDERYLPQLAGKYLNAADELSGSAAIASDTFKSTVTGEPVTGREVYRTAFTFRPIAQHVFCTNALPSFSGGIDRGVSRRLLVITFNRVIPKEERVEHIGLRIGEEETDLLLAWAVDGASRLIRQRDFTIPPSSKEALHDWLHSADPVIAWAQECVTAVDPLTAGWAETKIKRAVAHKVFTTWSESEGFPANKLPAANSFVQRLVANYPTIKPAHLRSGNWLIGLEVSGASPDGSL